MLLFANLQFSNMKAKLEHRLFRWGMTPKDFERTLNDVDKFVNRADVSEIVSIVNTTFGLVVWYRTFRTLKIESKKP